MKAIVTTLVVAPALVLAAACASTGASISSSAPAYWRTTTASTTNFPSDNAACAVRASRLGGGAVAPDNRYDRPMQKWSSATAQEVYESCMLERGWRPAG